MIWFKRDEKAECGLKKAGLWQLSLKLFALALCMLIFSPQIVYGGSQEDYIYLTDAIPIIFEGATDDAFELRFSITDITTPDKVVTFRDATGTVLLSGDTLTGDVTCTFDTDGSTATALANDTVAVAEFLASQDWGDMSTAADGTVTIDEDVIDKANFADEDWGHASIAVNVLTVEDFALNADADAGDYDIHSIDGLYGVDDLVYIDLGTDGYADIEADVAVRIAAPIHIGAGGSILADAGLSGILTLGGVGGTNNENLTANYESVANSILFSSGTGVTGTDWNADFFVGGRFGEGNRTLPAAGTDHRFRIYSDDTTQNADYGEFYCDQTDFNIDVGTGDLKLYPSAGGDVTLFEDTVIGNDDDGKRLYLYRKAGEGDAVLTFYIDSIKNALIVSNTDLSLQASANLYFLREPTSNSRIEMFMYPGSEDRNILRHYGYITTVAAGKYMQWEINDTSDYFELTREDANILGFDIKMPLVADAITTSAQFVATPDAITATDGGVAASIVTVNTEVTTNGDSDLDNVTLANGTSGQVKHIYCVVEGNAGDTWKITPATMCGGSQITFAGVGEGCTLVYADNEGWVIVANNGGTIS